jgi:UDP-N-acetylmuramate--alanine ligase
MKYLETAQNIFILGIKGVGMANLAVILKQMGKNVIGSDVAEEFITDETLSAHDIEVINDFSSVSVPANIDLFIYSAAHQGTQNPQARAAAQRDIPVVAQTVVLGELMQKFQNAIAVSGCHGKTTSSALMAYALEKLDVDPSFFIGTSMFQDKFAGEYDEQKYFVIEADEYGVDPPQDKTPKFLHLKPTHILCLNIDFDHPDIYKDIEATKRAFFSFFTKIPPPKLYLNADNMELMDTVKNIPRTAYTTFGFDKTANYQIQNPVIEEFFSQFELFSSREQKNLGIFQISLFGMQNISNAAGVVSVLLSLGFEPEAVKKAVMNFSGVKRRFEKITEENGFLLFDDYGHHPEEIVQTIASAKARFKDHRVVVIFQPHTYSRTNALKYDFVDALATADCAIVTPIFASAREKPEDTPITSEDLVAHAESKGITSIFSYQTNEQLLSLLKEKLQKGDIIFTMGAGDVYKLKNGIIELIKAL